MTDYVPRSTQPEHNIGIQFPAWSCSCGAGGVGGSPVELVRAAAAHEANPEEKP